MPKDLERDLGLYATITISIGAMIGSGIFVLPGLASKIAGPAVILAYLLAGVLVLPAALSKAEMATAMPEAGGTYLYIDRAMGPLPGTIAGIGAWFSLVFKSAFAIVGLGAYLLVFAPIPAELIKPVGLAFAALLLVVNVVGVKQSGRLQAGIVSVVLFSLTVFIADGLTYVNQTQYHPFFGHGAGGLLAATGFVFVSYAGVTKIASVAEEVEDPGRNIPISILASIVLMMLVYTLVVFVVVGVAPGKELTTSLTPMALAADAFIGDTGKVAIAGVAVLALTSMANAGILSSSRFPLAMSRDSLAPARLGDVHGRFHTPVYSIAFTGAVLLMLIVAVPVVELAKLASAFQILVFAFENVALVAFREADLPSYDPDFVAPGYPWVQLFGILGGVVLLTQMGVVPTAGALGIIVAGAAWYRVYGREKTEREGAALNAIRQSWTDRALDRVRTASDTGGPNHVLVPVSRSPTDELTDDVRDMIRIAADVVQPEDGLIQVVHFEEVPEQLDLEAASEEGPEDVEFEGDGGVASEVSADVEFGEVVTHDAKRAVVNFAEHYGVDLVLGEWHPSRWRAELLGADVDWYMQHTDEDFAFVRNRGYGDVDEITLIADRGPFDPLEVVIADAVASARGASIQFVTTLPQSASQEQVDATTAYLDDLASYCRADSETRVLASSDQVDGLVDASRESDLVVVGTSAHHVVYDVLFGTVPDKLVERLDCTVLLTHSGQPRRHTFLRAVLERIAF